jgi:hypothetical protein
MYRGGSVNIEKRQREDFDPGEAARVLQQIIQDLGFPVAPEPSSAAKPFSEAESRPLAAAPIRNTSNSIAAFCSAL